MGCWTPVESFGVNGDYDWTAQFLDAAERRVSLAAPGGDAPLQIEVGPAAPPARAECKLVEAEEPAAAAKELARLLHEEAKVI